MIELKPYHIGDFESIVDRLRKHAYERPKGELTRKALELVADGSLTGDAVTAWSERGIVAVAVAYEVSPGVAEVSLMETDLIEENPKAVYEASERWLASLAFRRIQAYCHVSFTVSYAYLRNLGFTCEGVLRGMWPDGSDCFMMARVK